jgi:pyridoxamine 5'-phosphate oxidase
MSFVNPKIHTQDISQERLLDETHMAENPLEQFRQWYKEVQDHLEQPEAMLLATCTAEGRPSARMVLLRGLDEHGFIFYTNYNSRKSQEILHNPFAALVFYWEPFDRQVRVEGRVEQTTAAESDLYYNQRPRGSRIGAWASPQSSVLNDRGQLDALVQEMEAKFGADDSIPRPPFWGGFRVIPETIEFWQGRDNRLHDRFRYRRSPSGPWQLERLAP